MHQRHAADIVEIEALTTDQITCWSQADQLSLRENLAGILQQAFPRMPAADRDEFLVRFFTKRCGGASRNVFLVKNNKGEPVGVSLFDHAQLVYGDRAWNTVYLNLRAVLPRYQDLAIGQGIALRVLTKLRPDVLMTTCTQSASLHSWIRLPAKGGLEGFEVYPHLLPKEGHQAVVPLPHQALPVIVTLFERMYRQIVDGDPDRVAEAMRNLTVRMVRRDVHHGMYDFHPWERRGRLDPVAQALGLTERDGVLVVFRKVE